MSKSLGNVLSIPAMLQRVRPAELRYYLGSAHYRSMLEFSENALQDAVKAYVGSRGTSCTASAARVGAVEPGEWTPRFAAALDDDLAVPIALAEVHHARAEGNRALDAGDHEGALRHAGAIRAMMGDPGLRSARRTLGIPRRDVGRAGRRRRAGAVASWRAGEKARETAQLGTGRRDPRPTQERRHRGHRHRRRTAVDAGR